MQPYDVLVRLDQVYDLVEGGWPVRIEYETAKIGRTREGAVVTVTFPDVYKRLPPVKSLREQAQPQHNESAQQAHRKPLCSGSGQHMLRSSARAAIKFNLRTILICIRIPHGLSGKTERAIRSLED